MASLYQEIVDRALRFFTILAGVLVLVIGLGITGLVLLCSTVSGCTVSVMALGIPAVGWGVILVFVGALMIAGGAAAGSSKTSVGVRRTLNPAESNPNLMFCPSCGGRTNRTFQFCQKCGKSLPRS